MIVIALWAAIIVVSLFLAAIIPVERYISNRTLINKIVIALIRTFIWILIMWFFLKI